MTEVTNQELLKSLEELPLLLDNMRKSIFEKRGNIDKHRAAIAAEYDAISDIEVAMDALRGAYVAATHQLAIRFSESVQAARIHGIKGVGRYVTVGELDETQCASGTKLTA